MATESDDVNLINNLLNNDCLEKIFEFLTFPERLVTELVCKRWREISKGLWRFTKVLNLVSRPNDDELKRAGFANHNEYARRVIKNCAQFVDKLELGDVYSYKLLFYIGDLCWNLTQLTIRCCGYDDTLANVFPKLEKLTYLKATLLTKRFPADMLMDMPTENLTELHIFAKPRNVNKIPDFPKVKNLKALTLKNFALERNTLDIIGDNKNLSYLNLCNSSIFRPPSRNPSFYIRDYHQIAKLVKLQCLYISYELNQDDLERIAHHCQELQSLSFVCSRYGDTKNYDCLKYLKNLRKLEFLICPVTDEEVSEILEPLENLEFLTVFRIESNDLRATEKLIRIVTSIVERRKNCLPLQLGANSNAAAYWKKKKLLSPSVTVEGINLPSELLCL